MKRLKIQTASIVIFGALGASIAANGNRFSGYYLFQKNNAGICAELSPDPFDASITGTKYTKAWSTVTIPTTFTTASSLCSLTIFAIPE